MASGPLKEYIGDFSLGSGAEDIMSGNYRGDKGEDLPAINHWLKNHIHRSNTPPIKVALSQQEYTDLFRNQKETTSSSIWKALWPLPSGIVKQENIKCSQDHDDPTFPTW
eukprot:1875497-Ditylum_brightwellii.AAC.1